MGALIKNFCPLPTQPQSKTPNTKENLRFFLNQRIFFKGVQCFERVSSSLVNVGVLVSGLSGGTYLRFWLRREELIREWTE